jgi:hypothetical protein
MVPTQQFARSTLLLDCGHPEHSGFKETVSCKFTLHETDYLRPVFLSMRRLHFKELLKHTAVLC